MVLAALYLPGARHGLHLDRGRWPAVVGVLRSLSLTLEDAEAGLRSKGLFAEAAALTGRDVLKWATDHVQAGRVLTCLDEAYPERWLAVLGEKAPPAFWKQGSCVPGSCLGIVGSRQVEPEIHQFCADTAREAVRLGYRVVSGGAMGCDRAALRAASEAGASLVLLPYGIDRWDEEPQAGQMVLSLCERGETFSSGRAMERNALIYASGPACVVGHARFREGGSWHGAADALRRRLTQVLIRNEEGDRAVRALVALGARAMGHADELDGLLCERKDWGDLFAGLKAG